MHDNLIGPLDINIVHEPKSYVLFPSMNISDYKHCYELHVFVMKADEGLQWGQSPKLSSIQDIVENRHYAGCTKLFGLKCRSCYDSMKEFFLKIDVTESLRRQNLELCVYNSTH